MRGRTLRRSWRHDPTLYAPPRYRRACSYYPFIPAPLGGDDFVDLPADVAGVVSEAEQAVIALNRNPGPELRALARLLLRSESISSSKVEEMRIDARDLARAEEKRRAGRSVGPRAAEILANIDAMINAVGDVGDAGSIAPGHLCEIHKVLLDRADPRIAGIVRDSQNWIGGNNYNPCGAAYVPPPPERIAPLLDDLCGFCNDDLLPPVVQAAIAHAQFELIHPFEDGNGRTGRALIHVVLRRRRLAPDVVPPLSIVFSRRRDRYIDGIAKFREGAVAEWIGIFAEAAAEAALRAGRYAELVADLQAFWRGRLRAAANPRADSAAWEIINALPAYPVVSAQSIAESVDRAPAGIHAGMQHLEDAGVLKPAGQGRRNRTWEPDGLIDLIEELEAGVP